MILQQEGKYNCHLCFQSGATDDVIIIKVLWGFPGGSDTKESSYNIRDRGSIPGPGRSGEGNGNSLQYSCLENSNRRNTISIFRLQQLMMSQSLRWGTQKEGSVSRNKLGNDQEFSFGHTVFESPLSNPTWDIKQLDSQI